MDQAPDPVEYVRADWEQVNRLARKGWRLVPLTTRHAGREMFVLERPLVTCHADHLMEEA